MIKVGIIGCDHHRAAELVRLLINHPDVELRWVMDAGKAGQRLDALVNGIVGECDLVVEPEGPEWHNIVMWGKNAEVAEPMPLSRCRRWSCPMTCASLT